VGGGEGNITSEGYLQPIDNTLPLTSDMNRNSMKQVILEGDGLIASSWREKGEAMNRNDRD